MRYEYDPESDCGYIYINEGMKISHTKEVTDNINVDFAEYGTIVGIGLISIRTLDQTQTLGGKEIARCAPPVRE